MAWIELHQAVWTHRKTFELAGLLDISETYAAAHMLRLWSWALDNAPDGSLSGISSRAIARGADWAGDAEAFVEALISAGWLDPDRAIHDWQDYAGRLIERRVSNTERMRAKRAANVQRTNPARAGATQPDTTVHNTTGPIPPVALQQSPADASASAPPKAQAEILRGLSDDAKAVLDHHREAHGRSKPAKLNPESAQALEEAVADLGLERLRESISFMARKIPAVPELSKAITAARTKRTNDAAPRASPPSQNGHGPPQSPNLPRASSQRISYLKVD